LCQEKKATTIPASLFSISAAVLAVFPFGHLTVRGHAQSAPSPLILSVVATLAPCTR
jgi:hypothetical protein